MGFEREDAVKEGPNYDAWNTPRLSPDDFKSLSSSEKLVYLVACAHLAPSTHNTQPWAFRLKVKDRAVEIFLDRNKVLPASDVAGRQACISVGCALANLTTAAEYFHYHPDLSLSPTSAADVRPQTDNYSPLNRYIPLAEISLTSIPDKPKGGEVLKAIFTRRMNRGKYNPQITVDDRIIKSIEEIGRASGTTIHLFAKRQVIDRARIVAIAELQAQADGFVANNQRFTLELGKWLLPNNTDSYLGMPGETFGLRDEQAERFHQGLLNDIALRADEKAGFAKMAKEGIESASLVGMISVGEENPSSWVKAGITLEKIALLIEQEGMALAVHAGLAEVALIRSMLATSVLSKQKPVILFRAGDAEESKPHSPRLPLGEVLLD